MALGNAIEGYSNTINGIISNPGRSPSTFSEMYRTGSGAQEFITQHRPPDLSLQEFSRTHWIRTIRQQKS